MTNTESKICQVPMAAILANPERNSRSFVDEKALQELATSLKREGLLQPVRVEQTGPHEYELVYGFRRFAAAQSLKWETILAEVVQPMADDDRDIANLLENLARENLTTYDQANALAKIQRVHGHSGATLAARVGKSATYVNNLIRIVDGIHAAIDARWREECSPTFGRDPETGKKLSGQHAVCTTDWLSKLVSKVPLEQQEYELQVALGIIVEGEDGDDGEEGEGGEGEGEDGPDAPKRKSVKQLLELIKTLNLRIKTANETDLPALRGMVATAKWALGKSVNIKVGSLVVKPGESTEDEVPSKPRKSKTSE